MELNVIKRDEAIEVCFEGAERIYILNQEFIRDELNWCLNIYHDELIINLKGIKFIDTTGFRLLIEMYQLYRSLGKKFKLVNVSKEVEELFTLVKVSKLFPKEEMVGLNEVAA